jgi:hypothetical protein
VLLGRLIIRGEMKKGDEGRKEKVEETREVGGMKS